jgi:AcrR family transcriptional regulator
MASQRIERRGVVDDLLDAALASVLDVGLRRTTLADVARRAGVSRMTVYRHFPDLATVVGALLRRELTTLLDEVQTGLADLPTARERLVQSACQVVARMDTHPLYRRVLDLDPQLLLPLIVERFGSTQHAALALIAAQVRAGQADGSIRAVDADLAAVAVLLTAQSFVFSARLVDDRQLTELAALLDRYLS